MSVTQSGTTNYHCCEEKFEESFGFKCPPAAGAPWWRRCWQASDVRLTECPPWAEWPMLPRPQTPLVTKYKHTMPWSVLWTKCSTPLLTRPIASMSVVAAPLTNCTEQHLTTALHAQVKQSTDDYNTGCNIVWSQSKTKCTLRYNNDHSDIQSLLRQSPLCFMTMDAVSQSLMKQSLS